MKTLTTFPSLGMFPASSWTTVDISQMKLQHQDVVNVSPPAHLFNLHIFISLHDSLETDVIGRGQMAAAALQVPVPGHQCFDLYIFAVLQSDRFIARGSSPLAPFPGKQMNEENRVDSDVRAASTGALIDEKEPLVLSSPCTTQTQRLYLTCPVFLQSRMHSTDSMLEDVRFCNLVTIPST